MKEEKKKRRERERERERERGREKERKREREKKLDLFFSRQKDHPLFRHRGRDLVLLRLPPVAHDYEAPLGVVLHPAHGLGGREHCGEDGPPAAVEARALRGEL